MTVGIVGKKIGMTRVFTEEGDSIPVTVIEAAPNRVTQRKTAEVDGYDAVQVAYGAVKPSRVSKHAEARGYMVKQLDGDKLWHSTTI